MSAPVNVLAVMDRGIADLMDGHSTLWTARDVKVMRAAVAELIEATDVLTDAITFRIDDPRHALLDRVVKALARVQGEPA